MRHLRLAEYETRPYHLTGAEAEGLAASGMVSVSRAPGADSWDVAANQKVGVIRAGDIQLAVLPKVAIDRLVFMMGYAKAPEFWRNLTVRLDAQDDLPEALAHTMGRLSLKAVEQGLLQGYKTIEEALPVLRGRIRVGDQIARRPGVKLPLEVTFDEFTIDIPENQILLAAVHRLLRAPIAAPSARRSLHRLRLQLAGVSELARGRALPTWIPSRLNTRYQPALHLAELVLASQSFEQQAGDVHVSGFVFDMPKIFEDFVSVALKQALAPRHGESHMQHTIHMDEDRHVPMRPDFLWTSRSGHRVVVDAKYKAERYDGFPQADLYQLLAYCTALEVPNGHLVYAKGSEGDKLTYKVRGTDVTIHCHTLELEQSPEGMLNQIAELAREFADSAA
jgi:5-methylcytosine-specific restriction enzyme subunit McrC